MMPQVQSSGIQVKPDTDTAVILYVQGSCSEMGGRIEGSPEACGAAHLAYTSAKQQGRGSCFKKMENKEASTKKKSSHEISL